MLSQREQSTYEDMWAVQAYAKNSPGEMFVSAFMSMGENYLRYKYKPEQEMWWTPADFSILDAGCGAGAGAIALKKLGFEQIKLADLTDAGLSEEAKRDFLFYQTFLWEDLRGKLGYLSGGKVDFVYCCDVMEHIPTPMTMLVVSRLLDITKHAAFFSISFMADNFGAWVGKSLHHTLMSFTQWKELLDTVGRVVEARDLLSNGLYLVEPR